MPRRSGSSAHAHSRQPTFPHAWPGGWLYPLIFVLALVAYGPALNGGLLWDDGGHITRADLRSFEGLRRIWFEIGATQQYYPLLHSAFWLEHKLWGDATLGYHLVNVLQHATAACFFGLLLRRLAVPGAALAALLFALHPVCVESVAWISEQKNTLSAVLYLGAALAYLRYDVERTRSRYAFATAVFVLALLTKTVTATLPAALLVVFWWRRGQLGWRRDVLPLLPWFAFAIGSGLFTAHFERALIGAEGAAFDLTLLERALLAGRVVWFYLGKLLWPAELAFIYPRWTVDAGAWWQWLFPLAAIAFVFVLWRVATSARAWPAATRAGEWIHTTLLPTDRARRAPLAAVLVFGGTLFPVLGFVNVYPFLFSYVADHFQYLASLAIFALAAAGLARWLGRFSGAVALPACGVLLLILGALTWSQAGTYRDVFTLYRTTLARNPAATLAHNNLAVALVQSGQPAEAIPHLEAALKLRPDYAQAHANLGDALTRLGRPQDALQPLREAIRLEPSYAQAHNNLGVALMALQRAPEAMVAYREAIRLDPRYASANYNLGLVLATAGQPADAIPFFQRAVEIDPDYADAELSWGLALMLSQRFTEAVPHFERALQLNPDSVAAHQTYGRALARHGRLDEAVSHFRRAVELAPGSGAAHLDLAFALRQLGRNDEAQPHFLEARRLEPGAP